MKLYAYVILENHLHLIAQSEQLGRDISRFKSYTAKNLIRYLDKNNVMHSHAGAWERVKNYRGFSHTTSFLRVVAD